MWTAIVRGLYDSDVINRHDIITTFDPQHDATFLQATPQVCSAVSLYICVFPLLTAIGNPTIDTTST